MKKISAPEIDWQKFYDAVSKMTVRIPIPGDGEIVAPVVLEQLLAKVQSRRQKVDDHSRRILMILGNLKAQLSVAEHDLRVARSVYASDPQVVGSVRGEKQKAAIVETLVMTEHQKISRIRALIAQYDTALSALKMTVETFDRAKETLNAMHRGAIAELTGRGNVR